MGKWLYLVFRVHDFGSRHNKKRYDMGTTLTKCPLNDAGLPDCPVPTGISSNGTCWDDFADPKQPIVCEVGGRYYKMDKTSN